MLFPSVPSVSTAGRFSIEGGIEGGNVDGQLFAEGDIGGNVGCVWFAVIVDDQLFVKGGLILAEYVGGIQFKSNDWFQNEDGIEVAGDGDAAGGQFNDMLDDTDDGHSIKSKKSSSIPFWLVPSTDDK